jgi:hypothetical protein
MLCGSLKTRVLISFVVVAVMKHRRESIKRKKDLFDFSLVSEVSARGH